MAQVISSQQSAVEAAHISASSAIDRIRAAQTLLRQDRARGLAALNEIFRQGTPSNPGGRCAGELIVLDIAPGATQLFTWLLSLSLPWKGKTFDAAQARGENIFSRSAYLLAHILFPFYPGYVEDGPDTFRAFAFRTYVQSGQAQPRGPNF